MIKLKKLLEESVVSIGININDRLFPFTDKILSGKKTIETRNKPTLNSYVGKRVGLIKTGKGKATLVGYVTVGEPIFYRNQEEFDKDYNKHLVSPDSPFYIKDGGKWGYPMLNPERTTPREINTLGIVSRKLTEEWGLPLPDNIVKNPDGSPKEFYHGTNKNIPAGILRTGMSTKFFRDEKSKGKIFVTDDKIAASYYGNNIVVVYMVENSWVDKIVENLSSFDYVNYPYNVWIIDDQTKLYPVRKEKLPDNWKYIKELPDYKKYYRI